MTYLQQQVQGTVKTKYLSAAYFATLKAGGAVTPAGTLIIDPNTGLFVGMVNGNGDLDGFTSAQVAATQALVTPVLWTNRPSAAGNSGTVIYFSDIGPSGALLRSDGTNYRPVNGQVLIAQRQGSLGTPLATVAFNTQFTLPVIPTFPAGLIAPHSSVLVFAAFRKLNANDTMRLNVSLGTAGNVTDSTIYTTVIQSNADTDVNIAAEVAFSTSTTAGSARSSVPLNSWAALGTLGFADIASGTNTNTQMMVSMATGSGNASDRVALIGYSVYYMA